MIEKNGENISRCAHQKTKKVSQREVNGSFFFVVNDRKI